MRGACRRSAEIVIADLDRQPRQFGVLAAGEGDIQHAAAGIELRIVEQVARLCNRRKRYIDAVEHLGKLGEFMPGDDFGDQRPQHRPRAHAVLVGLVRRIGRRSGRAKCSQKRRHCPSLVMPTKICSPSAVVKGS